MATAATSSAVPALCLKRPAEDFLDDINKETDASMKAALLAAVQNKKLRTDDHQGTGSHLESKDSESRKVPDMSTNEGIPSMPVAHRGFPCVWMNGNSPSRDQEGGEKSPNPPPPQLALPLETEGASTERSLHLVQSPGRFEPKASPHVQEKRTPPRNPFEDRPGLEHLFKSLNGSQSDSETSNGDAEGHAEVCPECQKVFKRKVYLQRHMEREHWSTAKVFKCEDCSYETKHQSNLSVHRRTHTGERPYHCGCCGQRYTQGHLLKSHIRSRHGGNMEFYNLDKKSESTRGRKSLDIKHDSPFSGPKVDKISALLQAAANKTPPGMPPIPKFNNLLPPPPMSGFPYFNGLRPMMNPVMSLANSLLGGPRFFTIGGLPSPAMIPHGADLSRSLLADPTVEPLNFKQEVKEESSPKKAPGIRVPVMVPESVQSEEKSREGTPQDLTLPSRMDEEGGRMEGDIMSTPQKAEGKAFVEDSPRSMAPSGESMRDLNGHGSAPGSPASIPHESQFASEDELMKSRKNGEFDEDSCYDDEHFGHSPVATVPSSCGHGNGQEACPHLKKLQQLRRNVFRMLSTFTPDLNKENGISNDGDDVDELLHEVMFSNIDDFMSAKD